MGNKMRGDIILIDRRTYLAGQALCGILANDDLPLHDIQNESLKYADAVLAELQKTCVHTFVEGDCIKCGLNNAD